MYRNYMVDIIHGSRTDTSDILSIRLTISAEDAAKAEERAESILASLPCNGYIDSVYEVA
jgi:hypothetical protein